METRLEKRKKRRKLRRIRKAKILFILILFGFTLFGLNMVNQNIVRLECLENPTMFKMDFKTGEIDLFGKTYIVDLKILKEID